MLQCSVTATSNPLAFVCMLLSNVQSALHATLSMSSERARHRNRRLAIIPETGLKAEIMAVANYKRRKRRMKSMVRDV